MVTTLYSNFSDAQGQITLVLVVVSGRNLNSSKLSCMSLLPAKMRMIDLKMKELECSLDFSHYKSMGIFPDAQGQLTSQSLVRSSRISNSSEMLWMFSLPASMKKIQLKMKALECSQHFPDYNPMRATRCHGHQSNNIIIIIMSLFNEDNIFSTSTNLTYGPRWKTYLTEQYHTIYTLYT